MQGVTAEQIWLRRDLNKLEISLIGTSDKVTVDNWFSGTGHRIEQFRTSSGQTLLSSQVDSLVSAMAAFAPPAAGETALSESYQTALMPVIGSNWQ